MTRETKEPTSVAPERRGRVSRVMKAARKAGAKLLDGVGEAIEDGIVGSKTQMEAVVREVETVHLDQVGQRMDLPSTVTSILDGPRSTDGRGVDLMAILRTGDSYIGVVRRTKPGIGGSRDIDAIGAVELRLGHAKLYAGDPHDLTPARYFGEIEPGMLKNNIVDGALKQWGEITIGRDLGNPDVHMSRKHADVEVDVYGRILVVNHSPNGTAVLTSDEVNRAVAVQRNHPSQTEKLVAILEANPTMFDPALTGKQVATGN